jgi:hypothetical protein
MDAPTTPKEPAPFPDLPAEDLQSIYDQVDEHLAFWNVVYNETAGVKEDGLPVPLEEAGASADWLKLSSAPLYASQGVGGARGLTYRLLNLGLKIFGAPQIQFNRRLRDFLGHLMTALQSFNIQAVKQKETLADLAGRIRALEIENETARQEIDSLTSQIADLRARLNSSEEKSGGGGRP